MNSTMTPVQRKVDELKSKLSRKSYFEKTLTKEEQDLILKSNGTELNEKIYCFINNITEPPVCAKCGKPVKFLSYGQGYRKYCSSHCSAISQVHTPEQYKKMIKTFKATMKQRYGVEYMGQLDKVRDLHRNWTDEQKEKRNQKSKETWLRIYGVDNPNKCKDVIEKRKQTNLERYGNTLGKARLFINNHSKAEYEIKDFIEKFGFTVVMGNRNILSEGKELDLYIPKKKVAIEYNGDYWHAMRHINHIDKLNECNSLGIKLIQIMEHDYIKYKDDILFNIMHVLCDEPYSDDFYIFSNDGLQQDAMWPCKNYKSITPPERHEYKGNYYFDCGKYVL